jgi:hypothetical protein
MGRTLFLPTSLKIVAAVGAAFVLWGLVLALTSSPARAEATCSTTADTTTCTFSIGEESTFEVPAGVSSVHVVATGARGSGISPGRGAQVSGDLAVTPGQTLYVEVGSFAHPAPSCDTSRDCIGGFNGGGNSGGVSSAAGGGGGASDVRTVSRTQSGSLGSRLIVAAGGGGAGTGASGGDAGSDGGAIAGGTGGKAGTQSEGGAGGSPGGQSGSLGQGGSSAAGGGGGGGLYGGGGGGSSSTSGGGGGGGSNLVPTGGTAIITSARPSIIISYTVPNQAPVNSVPDDQSTDEDNALTFNSANSNSISISDVDAGTSPVQVSLAVSHGTLTLGGTSGLTFATGDGTDDANMAFTGTIADINGALSGLRFDPDADYNGPAALSISTDDQGNTGPGGAKSDTDTVNITVNPLNDTPQVADDTTTYTMAEDANAITIDFGALVSDLETSNANLTYDVSLASADEGKGTLGSVVGDPTKRTFDSAENFNGTVTINYMVKDRGDPDTCGPAGPSCAAAKSASGTVTITVTSVNDPPSANAQSLTTNEDINKVITLAGNDIEGDTLSYKITSLPTNGKLLQGTTEITSADLPFSLSTNQVTYDPNDNYNNTAETADAFDFKVNDGSVDSAAAAKVSITVTPENDAPTVAVAAGGSCGTNDRSGTINLTVNDPDGQTQTGSLTLSATPSSNDTLVPTVTFGGSGASRTLTATALSGKTGTATITVRVSDGQVSGMATVNVQVGGNGVDNLAGTPGADMLFGQNGNDTLSGLGGKNLLCGGLGNDNLSGGADDDTLSGGSGNDRFTGGTGADIFSGGSGTDTATDFTAGVDTKSSIP